MVGLLSKSGGAQAASAPRPSPAPQAASAAPTSSAVKTLEVIEGPENGKKFDLSTNSTTIGRAPDNDLPLQDPSVSSHHARIDFHNGQYFLSDLQSSNGTYVNNNRVDQSPLNDKDLIALGSCRMMVNL